MTLRHMRILAAVVQQGSVTKAAESLHLAQPSISLALRELDEYYGVQLFARVGRRLSPTPCGREFYGYALHIISMVDELDTQMRNWDTLGTVRIGATVTIGTYLLPRLVRQLQSEFPDLQIEVKIFRASQIEQLVLDNGIDLGLIETQPEHAGLLAVAFSQDDLCAIVPCDSPLAGQDAVSIQDLAQYPFLMREKGSSVRTILEAYFALHHITVHPAWESVSTQTIIKAVAEGLGVAVLPKMLCKRDAGEGTVIMLPFDEPLRRTLHIICPRSKYLSVSMQRFVELCQSTEYTAC